MSERELAINLIKEIPENKLAYIISFLQGELIPDEPQEYIFNAETIEAFEEVERMKKNPSELKGYTDVDDMFEDILSWNIQ